MRVTKAAVGVLLLAMQVASASAQQPRVSESRTPETRTLPAAEAAGALERDWLFQAMGEPLLARASQEIGWTRELARRLGRQPTAPDLSAELRELAALEKRLGELQAAPAPAAASPAAEAAPNWIWYPEGNATQDAPAATRFFRRRVDLPGEARAAELRVAADDACEVFVNGRRAGSHETWQRTALFAVGPLLKAGDNLLAVRAENRPAPSKNPAGLIARLAVTLADGKQLVVVSDSSWRVENELQPQWEQVALDDASWKAAAVSAPFGGGPWGKIAGLGADVQDDPVAAYAAENPAIRDLYFSVRRIKRSVLFKNPVLDFAQVLFIDQPLPQGPINPEHEAIHRMGITAVPGGRLLVLDGLHPGGQLRQLAPDKPGSFWRPDLSFDSRRVLFCFKPHDEKSFHLYEMNLDGTGLRQLTDSE
ncbi:MAG: hypothetical protein MUF25_00005, partial [Pirellulaceae bacterium]|nr:hypothetical protein [Pirellulaceae bacterium]